MSKFRSIPYAVLAGSLLVGGSAYAQSMYGIDQRQDYQQNRIERGIQSGQITESEAYRLEAGRTGDRPRPGPRPRRRHGDPAGAQPHRPHDRPPGPADLSPEPRQPAGLGSRPGLGSHRRPPRRLERQVCRGPQQRRLGPRQRRLGSWPQLQLRRRRSRQSLRLGSRQPQRLGRQSPAGRRAPRCAERPPHRQRHARRFADARRGGPAGSQPEPHRPLPGERPLRRPGEPVRARPHRPDAEQPEPAHLQCPPQRAHAAHGARAAAVRQQWRLADAAGQHDAAGAAPAAASAELGRRRRWLPHAAGERARSTRQASAPTAPRPTYTAPSGGQRTRSR